jgi:hypothetical protein
VYLNFLENGFTGTASSSRPCDQVIGPLAKLLRAQNAGRDLKRRATGYQVPPAPSFELVSTEVSASVRAEGCYLPRPYTCRHLSRRLVTPVDLMDAAWTGADMHHEGGRRRGPIVQG